MEDILENTKQILLEFPQLKLKLIEKYTKSFKDDYYDIRVYNNVYDDDDPDDSNDGTNDDSDGSDDDSDAYIESLYCDFCDTECDGDKYYRCIDCNIDMCELCFSEKTVEIALENGSSVKKFNERKEKLHKCHEHELNYNLKIDYFRMVKKIKTHFLGDIGSLNGLIPIIEDEDGNTILINQNKESKTYNHFYLLNVDNHGRLGLFKCKETNLKDILDKFEELNCREELEGITDGWTIFLNCPFKKYMEYNNYETHYG
jgi:hypothetical protein